jgi:hypothetical protein
LVFYDILCKGELSSKQRVGVTLKITFINSD